MAELIKAPINYAVIAGGKIMKGGSVAFGFPNAKPDEANPATLKPIFLDSALTIPAQNPQPLSSDGVFDQSTNGTLFGSDNDIYSVLILDQNGVERSYIANYELNDANAASSAQDAANNAAQSEASANQSELNTNALYVDFVNRYLGAFSSDPSTDSEGNPPSEGSLYWNSVLDTFKVFDSGAWKLPQDLGFGTAAYRDVQSNASDFTAGRVVTTDSVDANGGDVVTKSGGYLGNAATKTIQTSGSDLTAGRVALTEGLSYVNPRQFGIGGQGPQLGLFDVDSASTGTVINVTGTDNDAATYNWPVLGTGTNPVWWVVETYGTDSRTTQRATQCFQVGGQEGAEYVRVRHDASWSTWFRIWSSADFATPPADATPTTKGIVKQPSASASVNGYWKCNETGIIKQWGYIASRPSTASTHSFNITFPNAAWGVVLTGTRASTHNDNQKVSALTSSNFQITNDLTTEGIYWMAVGN